MKIVAIALLLAFALYVFYLAYCTLLVARKNGKLAATPWPVRAFAFATLGVAVLLDVIFNATVGTVAFLEPPAQWTFTERCKRHMADGDFRGRIARWVCEGWLNPFEDGHC